MVEIVKTSDYKDFIKEIKSRIQSSQIKAAIQVNVELLKLYWYIGSQVVEKQKTTSWGDGLIKRVSSDLKHEFPAMKGFSRSNIKYMKQWFLFWSRSNSIGQQVVAQSSTSGNAIAAQLVSQLDLPKSQQVVGQIETGAIFQIPWGQNLVIVSKSASCDEALFYVQKTVENNWSRAVLIHHIESNLFAREGKAITNFEAKLPAAQSDLANQILKDPYNFDFLTLTKKHNEKELEAGLVDHITQFLLELGAGFSYVGKQYQLEVDGDEFFIDLLFYHIKLHCYVVVELKSCKFKPEFAGKLNFYVSAVDGELKTELDAPTIGILICKSKNNTVVEYALNNVVSPIGVSEYKLTEILPDELKGSLPTIEEIEAELEDGVE